MMNIYAKKSEGREIKFQMISRNFCLKQFLHKIY